MSDTGGFPLSFGSSQFSGKNNRTRVQGNAWGWENVVQAPMSAAFGYRNIVSSSNSFAFGQNNVISTNAQSAFCSGSSNTHQSPYSITVGINNINSATYGACFGYNGTVSGSYAFGAGTSYTASGILSTGFGRSWVASRQGEFVHSAGNILVSGDCQHGWLVAFNQTTSSTPTVLYLDGPGATNKLPILGAGTRWGVTVEIVAATTGAINKSARFVRSFQIDRPTTAASTTLVGSVQTIGTDTGTNAGSPPAGWAVSITADTTNGAPQFQVTGDTDTINWTAAIHYVQTIRV